MKRIAGIATVTAVLLLTGCGGGGDSSSESASGGSDDCLTAQEVQKQINQIANGFETSDDEVAAKQEQIKQIRAQQC